MRYEGEVPAIYPTKTLVTILNFCNRNTGLTFLFETSKKVAVADIFDTKLLRAVRCFKAEDKTVKSSMTSWINELFSIKKINKQKSEEIFQETIHNPLMFYSLLNRSSYL